MIRYNGKVARGPRVMPAIPPDHQDPLSRRPFALRCATTIFPIDEFEALSEYGNWLEALATGVIQPVNAEQEHFLAVDREETEPRTVCERAWLRLKGRREYEQEQNAPTKPEDYGIKEWDAERCWW